MSHEHSFVDIQAGPGIPDLAFLPEYGAEERRRRVAQG